MVVLLKLYEYYIKENLVGVGMFFFSIGYYLSWDDFGDKFGCLCGDKVLVLVYYMNDIKLYFFSVIF